MIAIYQITLFYWKTWAVSVLQEKEKKPTKPIEKAKRNTLTRLRKGFTQLVLKTTVSKILKINHTGYKVLLKESFTPVNELFDKTGICRVLITFLHREPLHLYYAY